VRETDSKGARSGDRELLGAPIGGTILHILLGFLTTRRNNLENLLHTRGGGVEERIDPLLDRILDLSGLLVEGGVRGGDRAELIDRSRQTVRNVLEASLNLRREFGGTGLDLLELNEHSVTEAGDLGLSDHVGGGGGLDDLLGGERGLVAVRI